MVRTVLVVEDNQIDRTRLVKILSDAGYEVSTAENGLQAIDQVKRNKPEAILMDVNMPEMDGFAATRALRGDSSGVSTVPLTRPRRRVTKVRGAVSSRMPRTCSTSS